MAIIRRPSLLLGLMLLTSLLLLQLFGATRTLHNVVNVLYHSSTPPPPTSAPTIYAHFLPEICNYTQEDEVPDAPMRLTPKPNATELDKILVGSDRPMSSELDLWDDTIPFLNVSSLTLGKSFYPFHSGYRNAMMQVTNFIMKAKAVGFEQILLPTLKLDDLGGGNGGIFFQDLFDIKHWNSFYPAVPRLVHCDPTVFTEYQCAALRWKRWEPHDVNMDECATRPYAFNVYHVRILSRNL